MYKTEKGYYDMPSWNNHFQQPLESNVSLVQLEDSIVLEFDSQVTKFQTHRSKLREKLFWLPPYMIINVSIDIS